MARHVRSALVLLLFCHCGLLWVPPARKRPAPRVALRQGPPTVGAPLLGPDGRALRALPLRLQMSEDRLKERVASYVKVLKTEMSPLLERQKIEGLTRFLHNFVKQKSRKKLLPLHPMLGLALRSMLPSASPETLAITSLALCYAGVREGSAWQELAKSVASGPQGFNPRALAELAWSFSEVRYAHQGVFQTLLRKMEEVKQMANEQEKSVFCWASGNLGFNCSAIFGPPADSVDPQLSRKLFQRLDQLATNGAIQILAKDPFPLLQMPQALSPNVCQELIRRADEEGLWQNSTVVGGSLHQVVMNNIRTSATATFNLPHHEDDELLYGIRSWAAQQLQLPTDYVEPLQIARYSRANLSLHDMGRNLLMDENPEEEAELLEGENTRGQRAVFVPPRYWKYASGLVLVVLAYAGRESLHWSREGLKVPGPQTVRNGPSLPQQKYSGLNGATAPMPKIPDTATEHNGIEWPEMILHGSETMTFMVIGDWGGMDGAVVPPNGGLRMVQYNGGMEVGPHVFAHRPSGCTDGEMSICFNARGGNGCKPNCGYNDSVDYEPGLLVATQMKQRAAQSN